MDFTATALSVVELAIGEHLDGTKLVPQAALNESAAVSRGRLGGLKGGEARAKKLSPAKRKAIAKKAAKSRWGSK